MTTGAKVDSTGIKVPSKRTPITYEEALRLAKLLETVPRRATARAVEAATEDPARLAADVGNAGLRTVSRAAAPILNTMQEGASRISAATAGGVDPFIDYVKDLPKITAPEDALTRVTQVPETFKKAAVQAWDGLTNKRIPFGTADKAFPDLLRKHGWPEGGLFAELPDQLKRTALTTLMYGTGMQPGAIKGASDVAKFATGPEGAGLAAEVATGDVINKGASGARTLYKASGAQKGMAIASDAIRTTPIAKSIINTFSHFGAVRYQYKDPRTGAVMVEDAREKLNNLLRQYVGEKGAEYWRLANQISGGKQAIEEGARVYKMLPEERSKFLEVVYENQGKGGVGHLDELRRMDVITDAEADWLKRVRGLLEESVPATRAGAGLKRGVLYSASERAGIRAERAIKRVQDLAKEAEAMLIRNMEVFDAEGKSWRVGFENLDRAARQRLKGKGKLPGTKEDYRLALAKAIEDADFATRNFSKTSRHYIPPADFDRAGLYESSLEDLLGIAGQGPAAPQRVNRALAPRISLADNENTRAFNIVVRKEYKGNGVMAVAFDKEGREVARAHSIGAKGKSGSNQAYERARKKVLSQLDGVDKRDIRLEKTDETGGRWSYDESVGPRESPIARFREIGKEIADRDKYFLNYLPRYESDELAEETLKREIPKRRGPSTRVAGERVGLPTTTQEEARNVIREKFSWQTREAGKVKQGVTIREPLQELTEALDTHARYAGDVTAKARFFDRVRGTFGIEARTAHEAGALEANGWIRLDKLPHIKSGLGDDLAEKFSKSYVPREVFEGLQSVGNVLEPVTRKGWQKFAHNLLQAEKTYLTILNPRFTFRNRMWEPLASYSRGNGNIKNWIDADGILAGKFDGKKVPGFDLTGEEMRAYLRREGVLDPGSGFSAEGGVWKTPLRNNSYQLRQKNYSAGEMVRTHTEDGYSPRARVGEDGEAARVLAEDMMQLGRGVLNKASEMNMNGEARARVAHWLWAMRDKKMKAWDARKEVAVTMFDYNRDFFTISEAGLKEWIPFYSWYRRIVPFALRTVVENPGSVYKVSAAQMHINALNGVSPEEMEYLGRAYFNSIGIVLPDDIRQPDGTKRVLNVPYAVMDPGQFGVATPDLKADAPNVTQFLRGGANMLRPTAQLALSYTYLASPLGTKYTGDFVKLPSSLMALPEAVQDRLGVVAEADGDLYGPSYIVPLVRYLEGGWGGAIGGLASDNPRNKAKLMNWLSGLAIDPEVPFDENQFNQLMGEFSEMEDEFGMWRRLGRKLQRAHMREAARDATGVVEPEPQPQP